MSSHVKIVIFSRKGYRYGVQQATAAEDQAEKREKPVYCSVPKLSAIVFETLMSRITLAHPSFGASIHHR